MPSTEQVIKGGDTLDATLGANTAQQWTSQRFPQPGLICQGLGAGTHPTIVLRTGLAEHMP